MEAIDFSCKHDILIRHKDGTLTPMDEPYYEVTQINERTWQIMSSGDYHYLVVGDEFGAAIDTGYGAGNLREFLEQLCGKPVPWVIDTHHHFDHTANNCYFDTAYMDAAGVDLAAVPYASFSGITFPRDYETVTVTDGSIIPLPGRELEIFRVGDHTDDGIAILDRTERMLFVGDEIMNGGKTLKHSVEKWHNDMAKLVPHRDEYDVIYGGGGLLDPDSVEKYYEASTRILNGEPGDPKPDKPEHPHPVHAPRAEGEPIIYDCQFPHPEDVPKGGPGTHHDDSGKAEYYWKGISVNYNTDKVHAPEGELK